MALLKKRILTAFITLNCCLLSAAYHERNGCQLSFGSCPFLTADNWLCTCSKWVLSAKLPAQKIAVSNLSPNCEAARHHWALGRDAFLVPRRKAPSPLPPSGIWTLTLPFSHQHWRIAVTGPCLLTLSRESLGRSDAGRPEVVRCPVPV